VRQHLRIAPWSEYVEVHWKDGLEAYVTPCANELVGVAFLWDRARYPNVGGGDALFTSLLRAFPGLQVRLDGACTCDMVRAVGPLHRATNAPVADGVLLVGDAAGYLDAITGEGISLATAQALCLEQTVVPLLQSQNMRETVPKARELMSYAQAHRDIVKPYYQVTQLVLFLSRHPRLAERVVKSLAQQPDMFQHMLSANMGLTPVRSIGLFRIARWARGLI
jgi:flavin-dependent dehydrogenase